MQKKMEQAIKMRQKTLVLVRATYRGVETYAGSVPPLKWCNLLMVRHDCIRIRLAFHAHDADLGSQEVLIACHVSEVESLMTTCFREFRAFRMLRNDEAWICILRRQDRKFYSCFVVVGE